MILQFSYWRILLIANILLLGVATVLIACGSSSSNDPEYQFASIVSAKLDPQIILVTNQDRFPQSKPIGYYVINRTAKTLYFKDQSLGVRVYRYDETTKKWMNLKLGFEVGNPHPVIIPARTAGISSAYSILPSEIPSTGLVRLVVFGWTDPANPEGSKIAAFIDIEIENQ